MSKYYNDAIVGNSTILGCLTKSGELIRLYYPNIDYYQNIDVFKTGVIDNNRVLWLHEGKVINQYYEGNILNTELIINDTKVKQRDYVLIDKNVLVRKYIFSKSINFLIYSKLNSNPYRLISGMIISNALIQYSQDIYTSIFTNKDISDYQINNAQHTIENGEFDHVDYIGMSDNSAISYNDINEITVYIALDNNLKDAMQTILWAKKQDEEKSYNETKIYWEKYLNRKIAAKLTEYTDKENKIIERSILTFSLLSDKSTGGMLASPDVDELFSKCGRYGYCWPRDALFVNRALALCGMKDIIYKFYNIWARKAQLDNGLFEQRYFVNGNLAPSWGVQIDETASMLIGIDEFGKCRDFEKIIVNGTKALLDFVDLNQLSKPCYDIWEERRGIHLYSTASIYEGLKVSRKMLLKINNIRYKHITSKIERILPKIKDAIKNNFIEDGIFKRSIDDKNTDISTLGVTVPFDIVDIKDNTILNTLNSIESNLKLDNGGYLRYQYDNYIGGNAWIISSLWLALFYIKQGNKAKAKELFNWVTNHADNLSFLPEQIDKITNESAWIKQLAWSHAMYIIVAASL